MTFEEAYEEYYDVVFKSVYMRMLSRENTEDVVQEAFVKAMNSWNDFDESKASVKTWLCTIARNTMINYIRNNKKHENSSIDDLNEAGFEPGAEDNDAREAYELLKPLKPQDRELLVMRYVEEMSYKEIAEKVGSNDKAVAKKVERLLKKCREMNLKGSVV